MSILYRVGGLSYLEKLELDEELPKHLPEGVAASTEAASIKFEEQAVPPDAAGEPVTLAVVVGGLALKGLIAYLLLRDKKDHFSETIEVEYPDGRRVTHTIDCAITKERPAADQVLDKLAKVMQVPIGQLTS